MQVTAQMVKELRELTGAGMMDCKKALVENDGDIDKSVDFLRQKGLGQAKKKTNRVAAEGVISLVSDGIKSATMIEVNSETDFVAKNENFKKMVEKTTRHIHDNKITDLEVLKTTTIDGVNFEDFFQSQIATIGENMVVRRNVTIDVDENSIVKGYVHFNGRVGCLVNAKCDSPKTAQAAEDFISNICMHISAMNPKYLDYSELNVEFVEKELLALKADIDKENEDNAKLGKHIRKMPEYGSMLQLSSEVISKAEEAFKEELKAQGKPEKIWDKILPGQIHRYIVDNTQIDQQFCLNSQFYVLDDSLTVKEAVEKKAKELGGSIEIVQFVRLEVGEGIEKKMCDFAAEVAEAMGK